MSTTPISYTVRDAVRASGLGRTTIYKNFNNGKLQKLKVGRRTLVLHKELEKLVTTSSERVDG